MFLASLESEQSRGYFPGHVLVNRYELLRLLGEGGTGVVWVAHDRVLNLEVAVKLVREYDGAPEDFARRTQLEARSAAKLAHPAVCRAMDFGLSAQGEPFIVSELLSGESLDDSLARMGRLEATHAVRVLLPILDALRAAHESGIVHRDVKPANIFLARDGLQRLQPKLLDFGIACWLGDTRATNEAGICGTPGYMSPEQASGSDDIDGRSDLWNFCATLYEVLTGVVPFPGETQLASLCAVQSVDPEPISTFCAGDEVLSAIVQRGMRRSREDRWQSARELAGELCHWLLARGVETDVCDHSLRARLVDRPGSDSGQEAPYAHVLPRDEAARGARAGRDGGAAVGVLAGTPRWTRFWLAAAAGTVLVAAASSFQALRASDQPFEHPFAPATPAPLRAALVTPRPPALIAPHSLTRDGSDHGPIGPAPAQADPAAVASPASVAPARIRRAGSATPGVSASATSPPVVTPAPPSPPARRRTGNALNYDFGL